MKLPYFRWYPKEFETDEKVKLMTIDEIGLYALCLNHQWVNGSIPADPIELTRALKVPKRHFQKAWPRVVVCFEEENGRLRNPRMERDRAEVEIKSAAARASAEVRWGNADAKSMRSHCEGNARAYGSDSVSGSEEVKPTNAEKASSRARGNLLDESWPKFQAAYPGLTATPEDWAKARPLWDRMDWEQKLAAIDAVALCDPAYVKLPQNYLADREWTRKLRPEPKSKLDRMMEAI